MKRIIKACQIGLLFLNQCVPGKGFECLVAKRAILIRQCRDSDLNAICKVINDGARAYKEILSENMWKEPYMLLAELQREVDSGIRFWGYEEDGDLVGVMGIQPIQDITLIRHAYVRTANQNQGIGGKLLESLRQQTARPILVGTWASAVWAISFYEKLGFRLISQDEKDQLLRKYWSISERQIQNSVVLASIQWFNKQTLRESTNNS